MSRIRTIKPEFFTSEDVVALSPLARIFFIALWCEADREGRLEWRPKTLKMRYMPADECDVEEFAIELVKRDMLVIYGVGSRVYAEIPAFTKHQVINNRESESILPPRPVSTDYQNGPEGYSDIDGDDDLSRVTDASSTRQTDVDGLQEGSESDQKARVGHASLTRPSRGLWEGKGREGKARDDARRTSTRKTSMPADFAISDRVRRWAEDKNLSHELPMQFEAFMSYAKRKAPTYADWDEALMAAVRDNWAKVDRDKRPSRSATAGAI